MLASAMAIGSVTGALLAARRERPHIAVLLFGAAAFGISCGLAAIMPGAWLFGLVRMLVGASSQTFTTTVNSTVQLSTEPAMRGRIAILLAIAMGGTPIGAPIVGRVADKFGPRWGLGIAAAAVGAYYLVRYCHLRIGRVDGRFRLMVDQPVTVTSEHTLAQ